MAIYTNIIKRLPTTNILIETDITISEFNQLKDALHYLFDSDTLTKDDYQHIFKCLDTKFPILELSLDSEKYKNIVIQYATLNYVPNPDIEKVLTNFITNLKGLDTSVVLSAIKQIAAKLPDCSDFVGIEVHKKGFTLEPLSEQDFSTIRKIILCKKPKAIYRTHKFIN